MSREGGGRWAGGLRRADEAAARSDTRATNPRRPIVRLDRLIVALLLVLAVASPALATVATIETTAPLPDHSEQAIRTAVTQAVRTAARGAAAMGLPWIQLRQALVFEDRVAVQVIATDTRPEEEQHVEPESGEAPGAEPGQPGKLRL